jgi:hypothetical protein
MWHRELLGDDLVSGNVDEAPTFGTAVAPAIDHVAAAHRRDMGRLATEHCHAVQVAAVLGR